MFGKVLVEGGLPGELAAIASALVGSHCERLVESKVEVLDRSRMKLRRGEKLVVEVELSSRGGVKEEAL